MIEKTLIEFNNRITKSERTSSRYANTFVGDRNQYPQVGTGIGWKYQRVNGIEYYAVGDLWLSTQLFYHKVQFQTTKQINKKDFILSLVDCTYIEYGYIYVDGASIFSISIGDLQRDIDIVDTGVYNLDIEQVLLPLDMGTLTIKNKGVTFAIELAYRILL